MVGDILRLYADITILYVGVVLLSFIVGYGVFFNWRSTSGGRSVMYFVCSLELLIFLAAFLNWVHVLQPETEQLLRVEVYLAIAAAATRMLFVLIRRWRVTGEVSIEVPLRVRGAPAPDEPAKEGKPL